MRLSTSGALPAAVAADQGTTAGARRTATTRRYLMCPPTYFGAGCLAAAPPGSGRAGGQHRAASQWQRIHDLHVELGHLVEIIRPVPGLPGMVFAAAGATVIDGRALVARLPGGDQAAGSTAYLDWFAARGLSARQAAWANAGERDYLAVGGWLLAGSGFQTDRRAHAESEEFFGRPVIGLTLVDSDYSHLDTALAVLDEQTVMYYPAAFTAGSQQILRELFPGAIIATSADAACLGLNAISDGHHVLLPAGASRLGERLRERGYEPVDVDVSELLPVGGGVKCCTLELRDALPQAAGSGLTVVLTSVASDSHTWNLVFLQLALEELGHHVVNLGACVPDELVVTECLRSRPDLIVVSSVNGNGARDGTRLIGRIRATGELAATPVVIGGKLGIDGPGDQQSRDQLLAAGFDAVFEDGTEMTAFRSFAGQLARGASG